MKNNFTKADLEQILSLQCEKLHALQNLLEKTQAQNEMLTLANGKLKEEIKGLKQGVVWNWKLN